MRDGKKNKENENNLNKDKKEENHLYNVLKNRNDQILDIQKVRKIRHGILGGMRRRTKFGLGSRRSNKT